MFDFDLDYQLLDWDEKPKQEEKSACPKCGRKLGKGGHFHIKACDGNPSKAN